jgi:hypothetical protein
MAAISEMFILGVFTKLGIKSQRLNNSGNQRINTPKGEVLEP